MTYYLINRYIITIISFKSWADKHEPGHTRQVKRQSGNNYTIYRHNSSRHNGPVDGQYNGPYNNPVDIGLQKYQIVIHLRAKFVTVHFYS